MKTIILKMRDMGDDQEFEMSFDDWGKAQVLPVVSTGKQEYIIWANDSLMFLTLDIKVL